ncbi:HAD family hydrolase [Bacillus taeanensis]|nr:HAD-IA family hydrolase [Bacillus taeanensis]
MERGILFDMDNTLLQSNINFKKMRADIAEYVKKHGITNGVDESLTSGQIIELVREKGMTSLEEKLWEIAAHHETEGMNGAVLEDGALSMLQQLKSQDIKLAVVTNNAYEAGKRALIENNIFHFFDEVIGREGMEALKPSPSGLLYVIKKFPNILWLMVGDSWIDGKAATAANIPFIGYQKDVSFYNAHGIKPKAVISRLQELDQFI